MKFKIINGIVFDPSEILMIKKDIYVDDGLIHHRISEFNRL